MGNKIPKATAKRLPLYYRLMNNLSAAKVDRVSSAEISEATKIESATVRRDFSCFGALGRKGYGYDVQNMLTFFKSELSQDQVTKAALIGVGNLGSAFLNYNFSKTNSSKVFAAFDVQKEKVGTKIGNIDIFHMDDLEDVLDKNDIDIVILTVPSAEAAKVAKRLGKTKIKGILNFAPITLNVAEHITIHNIDLSVELQSLIYFMK